MKSVSSKDWTFHDLRKALTRWTVYIIRNFYIRNSKNSLWDVRWAKDTDLSPTYVLLGFTWHLLLPWTSMLSDSHDSCSLSALEVFEEYTIKVGNCISSILRKKENEQNLVKAFIHLETEASRKCMRLLRRMLKLLGKKKRKEWDSTKEVPFKFGTLGLLIVWNLAQ